MQRMRAKAKVKSSPGVPQECPSEKKCDLRDPSVPPAYEWARHMFSLVLSDGKDWLCPVCGHRWPRKPGEQSAAEAAQAQA